MPRPETSFSDYVVVRVTIVPIHTTNVGTIRL